jgi:hypothetical protein
MFQFKKVLTSFHLLLPFIPILLIFQACTDSEEADQPARLKITLVDSPADYEAVNIDIREVSLKTTGTDENNGWIKLNGFKPGVYDILEFTGGHELILADMDFPAGKITQLQLKIGPDNSVVIRGYTSYLLNANNAASGLLMNLDIDLQPGKNHDFTLDFDASRSVTGLGNTGQLVLKPVLRLFSEQMTGSVKGKVLPASVNVLINVIQGSQIVASSYATKDLSTFLIPGIDEGSYRVSFISRDNYEQLFIDNIQVLNGKITDMGTIYLEED